LTTKIARIGRPNREIGTQPRIIWEVVEDVKKSLGLLDGNVKGQKRVSGPRVDKKTHGPMRGGVNARGGSGNGERDGKSGKI
jgi:hypothetical protein